MRVHRGLDASRDLDAGEPHHIILELDEVVRRVRVDGIRCLDSSGIDEASPRLAMIERFPVL
jgi:hypothetical protein